MLIAKYKFDSSLYDLIPEFNSGYEGYTYVDEIDENIVTRTIECDILPTEIRFENVVINGGTNSLLEILYLDTSNLITLDISALKDNSANLENTFTDMSSLKYIKCNNINALNRLIEYLPTNPTQGTMLCKQRDLSDLDMTTLNSKNWTVVNEPILVAKYVFDKSIYNNTIPEFNTNFEGYFIEDVEIEGNEVTRVIESCGMLPTLMRFGMYPKANGIPLHCRSLMKVLYINNTDITDMRQMFYRCVNVSSINMPYIYNVFSCFDAFAECNNLTQLDVSNWDTSKVVSMETMFYGCNNLTTLDVSNWNISKVTNIGYMFQNCNKLTSLDVSNWDTSNVITMNQMFYNCQSLTSLDISNFDMTNVTSTTNMFHATPKLTDIGMLNCDKSTIQKVADLLPTGTNRTIWYKETNIKGITLSSHVKLREYIEENVEIVLNSPLLEGDTIEMVDGNLCHYHRMGKVVLDGSEGDWERYTDINTTVGAYILLDDLGAYDNVYSNNFIGHRGSSVSVQDIEGFYPRSDLKYLYLKISKSKLSTPDLTGFKQWLSENPTTVVYELAEPYYEDITPHQSSLTLRTFNECSMEIITNLPVKTNITYRTNITSAYELERQVNSVDTSGVSLANLIEEEVDE